MPLVRRASAVAAVVCGTLVVVASGSLTSVAQEPATTKGAATTRKKGDPVRRVPDYFGQVALTPEQKTTIYGVIDKHMTKIEALEKQIEAHKAEMLTECEGVLDDTQKKLLTKLRAASTTPASAKTAEPAKAPK